MLRLALSRLLRVKAVRVASVLGPRPSGVAVASVRNHYSVQTSRFFSSRTHDEGSWATLAVRNSLAWQQAVRPSFLTFLHVNKHLMVPVSFCVPVGDETWPQEAWGYPLGKHAQWLRKQWREGGSKMDPTQKEELDGMSFAWDWSQYKWDHFILPALRQFEKLNGHTDVPKVFVIPKDDPEWPDELWGQRLGNKVFNIRNRGDFAKQVKADGAELQRLNFCHDSTILGRDWRDRVMPALRVFRDEFGHCNVMQELTVPSSSPWPTPAWGLKLGAVVNKIRSSDAYSAQVSRERSQLEAIDFVWDFFESEWRERIMPALKMFYVVNGHSRVPGSFVVPSGAPWPENIHGLKLGNAVSNIRCRGNYFDQISRAIDELEAIEFELQIPVTRWERRVEPMLASFEHLHGHRDVPLDFVVPSSEAWEEKDWGISLGKLRQKDF